MSTRHDSIANGALSETDKSSAEMLIRSTAEVIGKGAPGIDVDGIVQRNLPLLTPADIKAGRLATPVLGDIIGAVETAKGNRAFNWGSATPAQVRAYLTAQGIDSLRHPTGRTAEADNGATGGRSGRSETGRSYSELPGEWSTAKLQGLAEKLGVGWAANNPELLRLGPTAIQALADVHLKQENYQRLTGEFGLTSKETVETAKQAKKAGVDLNAATEQATEIRGQLPADQRETFSNSIRSYMPHLTDPAAKEKLNRDMEGLKSKNPAMAPKFEKLQETLKSRAETELKTGNEKLKTHIESAVKETKAGDAKNELAALLGQDKKTQNTEPSKPATQAKPAAKQPSPAAAPT